MVQQEIRRSLWRYEKRQGVTDELTYISHLHPPGFSAATILESVAPSLPLRRLRLRGASTYDSMNTIDMSGSTVNRRTAFEAHVCLPRIRVSRSGRILSDPVAGLRPTKAPAPRGCRDSSAAVTVLLTVRNPHAPAPAGLSIRAAGQNMHPSADLVSTGGCCHPGTDRAAILTSATDRGSRAAHTQCGASSVMDRDG